MKPAWMGPDPVRQFARTLSLNETSAALFLMDKTGQDVASSRLNTIFIHHPVELRLTVFATGLDAPNAKLLP